ncbi:uncharacterized protein BJ171DRAFT_566696 [Polychytrium aggregatum]|uniref:uncharacterized protein n=1 Tax=Polychytrium aggregatum TaxID=110093 RepID=UPI0022FDB4FA|nr:uncharacterized protein BJ171DRAFT_566696 [Polychytrium aggregatum]KAI9206348.1 hypothetical protein BJ171DRAFT_566696 [Polychytrium aggregatum]
MDTLLLRLVVLLGCLGWAHSLSCGSAGNWTIISSQSALAQYANCTQFLGSVSINGSDVSDLSPLHSLTSVQLAVEITNTKLFNLQGLSSLQSIGDKFFIHSNPSMAALDGLAVQVVTGGIFIYDLPVLKSISSLKFLNYINPNGSAQYPFGLSIYRNPALSSLDGLQNLKTIGNSFFLGDLPLISDFTGLPANITTVNFTLSSLSTVASFKAFPPLAAVPGTSGVAVTISSMSVSTLDGLVVPTISNLTISSNSQLTSIAALKSSTLNGPAVTITQNNYLCDYSGINTTALAIRGGIINIANNCGSSTVGSVLGPTPTGLLSLPSSGRSTVPGFFVALVASLTVYFATAHL